MSAATNRLPDDRQPVIIDAARTPFGKREGNVSGLHAVELLGAAQTGVLDRINLDAAEIEQVIGGCVTPVGEQYGNIVRTSWMHAGHPHDPGCTTIDAMCGTSLQAVNLLAGQIAIALSVRMILSTGFGDYAALYDALTRAVQNHAALITGVCDGVALLTVFFVLRAKKQPFLAASGLTRLAPRTLLVLLPLGVACGALFALSAVRLTITGALRGALGRR